jgi:transcriptional regulator with XRE-family HTH domain
MMHSKKLADVVRDRRNELRLTQDQLGEMVGVTKQQISNIEQGKTELPSPAVMARLARALQVAEFDLLRSVGYLQRSGGPTLTQAQLESEWRRIQALPFEERMRELKRLSPATYELIVATAHDWLDQTMQQSDQPAAPARGSARTDRPT